MQSFLTQLRAAVCSAAVGLAASALFAPAATAAPTVKLGPGFTSVALSPQLLGAATALRINLSAVEPALVLRGTAFFPFSEGTIDEANAKGEIIHAGGLSLKGSNTTVTLTNFLIDTTGATPVLTGLVTAGGSVVGRIPLFDLTLPALSLPLSLDNFSDQLTIRNVNATLTSQAAAALNSVFGVTAFTKGLPIGTATVVEEGGFSPIFPFFPPFPGFFPPN